MVCELLAYLARVLPSCKSVSKREERIFTRANSAATKKPFINTKNTTKINFNRTSISSNN